MDYSMVVERSVSKQLDFRSDAAGADEPVHTWNADCIDWFVGKHPCAITDVPSAAGLHAQLQQEWQLILDAFDGLATHISDGVGVCEPITEKEAASQKLQFRDVIMGVVAWARRCARMGTKVAATVIRKLDTKVERRRPFCDSEEDAEGEVAPGCEECEDVFDFTYVTIFCLKEEGANGESCRLAITRKVWAHCHG